MPLTLAEARRIVAGAIAEARKRNVQISVTVCDADGRLIALNRMDGAAAEANRGSIGKAIAAASFGKPSGASELSGEVFSPRTGTVVGEGLPIDHRRGGLPVVGDAGTEGGCGVDGAGTGEADEACARAGLAMAKPSGHDL
jgi:glc operon protein GlcG